MKALKPILAGAALVLLPLTSHAAFIFDAEVGAAVWSQGPSGSARANGESLDIEDNLGLERETSGFIWAAFEPMLLPNIKLRYTPMSFDGRGTANVEFGDIQLTGDVATDVQLDQLDATLYIQPLNNVVKLGLGLNVKLLNGHFDVRDLTTGQTENISISNIPVPMLYANAGFSIPFTGLSGQVEASGIAYGDNRVVDVIGGLRYRVLPFVRVEAGYRYQELRVDDDDIFIDMKVQGPYAGVLAAF